MKYDILLCRKCGWVNAGRAGASTFSCCHCGTKNAISRSVRLATGVDSREVQGVMARMKMERGGQPTSLG